MHRGTEQRLEECSQEPRDARQQPQEPQARPRTDSPEPPVGVRPATPCCHISGLQTVRNAQMGKNTTSYFSPAHCLYLDHIVSLGRSNLHNPHPSHPSPVSPSGFSTSVPPTGPGWASSKQQGLHQCSWHHSQQQRGWLGVRTDF